VSLAEFFGYVAAMLGVLQAWPQTRKVRSLGHGRGVSITMWVMMSTSNAAWLGYGFRIGSPSLITSTVASACLNLSVVLALVENRRLVLLRWVPVALVMAVGSALLPGWLVTPVLFVFTLSRVPQIMRSWKSRRDGVSGSAVSMGSVATSMACLVSWEFYSFLLASPTLIGTTSVALMTNIIVAYLELTNTASRRSRVDQ
jgi:uncharacterized protein with PQ loop repeat